MIPTDDPAGQRQDRDPVAALPRQDALVVLHRSERPEHGLDRLVSLVRFAGLGDRAHRHLRGQAERLPKLSIDLALQTDLVCGAELVGDLGDPVRRRVAGAHGGQQRFGLLRGRSHALSLAFQALPFLPMPEGRGFLGASR